MADQNPVVRNILEQLAADAITLQNVACGEIINYTQLGHKLVRFTGLVSAFLAEPCTPFHSPLQFASAWLLNKALNHVIAIETAMAYL